MNRKYVPYLIIIIILFQFGNSKGENDNKKQLRKTQGTPNVTKFNINNISTYLRSDGDSELDNNGNGGFVYPKGSGKTAVFESGFLWGAKVNGGEVRVGGSAYSSGLQSGKIISPGVAEDPNLDKNRIYRVRSDYASANLSGEAVDEGVSESAIFDQYQKDWNEWPASDGAPYTDIDSSGVYDPSIDIPGVAGANQTIWFVANDLNPGKTQKLYGSDPMGIEMQVTIWGYSQAGPLGNMFFRKYKIINKGNDILSDTYVTMWSDVDIGDASDDYAGCDTSLSLGYAYNANPTDATYKETVPPAVGFDFFQGPIVDSPGDSAIFNGQIIHDKKNLPMTAFYYFARGDLSVTDPTTESYEGTLQFYNFMQGKIGKTGALFTTPVDQGSVPTPFVLAGDPTNGTGWVDGQILQAGDRRIGSASGPFTMNPGDEQEVVVAEIAAIGGDYLGSVTLLKNYDKVAQDAYDNFFRIPQGAQIPNLSATPLDGEVILSWSGVSASATEKYNERGYKFQGYNVYQLPSPSASKSEGKLLATYDIIDEVKTIYGFEFDPRTGNNELTPVQFGTDNGIVRTYRTDQDAVRGLPLYNGTRYYFAVTSYSYNPDPLAVPNVLENPISVITVVPQSQDPGVIFSSEPGESSNVQHEGSADAQVDVTVVDPTKLTGDNYEVYFDQQHYFLDKDGKWKKTNFPDSIGKSLNKDVSPSSMSGIGVYSEEAGTINLMLSIDLQSPDGDYIDGVKLTFPSEVTINSAGDIENCANGSVESPTINGQEIFWGNNDTTTFGCFDGNQILQVNVNSFTPPITINYLLYDDGFGDSVGDTAGIINASGSFQITSIGNKFVTQNHWNLKNVETGEILLQDQTIIGGTDIYEGVDGPGGSSALGSNVGASANPIVDGLQVSVSGSYAAPITIQNLTLNDEPLAVGNGSNIPYDLTDYTFFGNITGWANEKEGYGSISIDELQQDYEFRFTGELDSIIINGKKVYITKEGTGSIATFYGARNYDLANHPLNPNPGSSTRFTVRIPFEVWNIDQGIQVNYQIYDRDQADPTVDGFEVWNRDGRMYCEVLNTPYSESVISESMVTAGSPDFVGDNFTWNNTWYNSLYTTGDIVKVFYANPLQLGKDKFTFESPAAPEYNETLAQDDIQKINVFPNPYYGVNPEEINKYQRFVTINHLPKEAKIRIYNLAGGLVKTINKNSESQFQRWDLANNDGLPVASGLYIIHIDMPELGREKILKAAIVQEQQVLDRF